MTREVTGKRFLAVGPLPPPIGGDTVSFSRLVESRVLRSANVELEVLDTSRKETESKFGRKLDLRDFVHAVTFFSQAFRRRKSVDGILIWANSRFSYTLGLLLIILYRMSNKLVILKLFGGSFEEEYPSLPGWYQSMIKRIFDKVDVILPQSKQLCRFFIDRMGIGAGKVVHFPNFLPFLPVENVDKPSSDQTHTVFVGQIRKKKGVFDIIEALRQESRMTCTFYGPIFTEDEQRFHQALQELPNASYGGILSRNKVLETIASYDVLLLPSFHLGEGYPAVIIEAFFSSIPVIATKWRTIPEIVHHGKNGFLVEVNAPEEIAESVRTIMHDRAMYKQMCQAAKLTALQYTEAKVVGEILLPLLFPAEEKMGRPVQLQRG